MGKRLSMMISRKAKPDDLDQIYMMGFDVWSESAESEYLEVCRSSTKYAKVNWHVLEGENGDLVCSLIVYKFAPDQFGIGSIATPKEWRKRGYATRLISDVLKELDESASGSKVFLYSDIDPKFYEGFGFIQLPSVAQRYKTTTCMVRGTEVEKFFSDKLSTPEYF